MASEEKYPPPPVGFEYNEKGELKLIPLHRFGGMSNIEFADITNKGSHVKSATKRRHLSPPPKLKLDLISETDTVSQMRKRGTPREYTPIEPIKVPVEKCVRKELFKVPANNRTSSVRKTQTSTAYRGSTTSKRTPSEIKTGIPGVKRQSITLKTSKRFYGSRRSTTLNKPSNPEIIVTAPDENKENQVPDGENQEHTSSSEREFLKLEGEIQAEEIRNGIDLSSFCSQLETLIKTKQENYEKEIKMLTELLENSRKVLGNSNNMNAENVHKKNSAAIEVNSKRTDLRKTVLKNIAQKNSQKAVECHTPKTKIAVDLYNKIRNDCVVLCTPVMMRSGPSSAASSVKRSLSTKVQTQCLMLLETPK